MNKIRKGDEVIVITGRDKGKRGKVSLRKDDSTLVVEGINLVKKHTKPNPLKGLPGGIVQKAIGIPVQLFTAIFALARTVGWIAQLNEMIGDPEYKIGRPRQLYTGAARRDVKPVDQR